VLAARRACGLYPAIAGLALAIVPIAGTAVLAAEPEAPATADRREVYPAEFFARFAPSTALDMARRVPGFAIDTGGGDVRGFAGAAGNVVFDGARASSKSEGIEAILARIPARRVIRIEVGPGHLFGSDFAGKSQVLNLVLSREGGIDGNVKASAARLSTGKAYGNLEGSVLIRTGGSMFNLSGGSGRFAQVERGFDDIRRASDGTRVEFREKVNHLTDRSPYFSASWAAEHDASHAAHFNLRYAPGRFKLDQSNHVIPEVGPARDDVLSQILRPAKYEVGGDLTRPLAGGALKLVALANRRERDDYDASFNRIAGVTTGGFEQTVVSRYDEVVGRASWSHPRFLGLVAEFGSELAFNRLDNRTALFAVRQGGVRSRIDLPVDQAEVSELRSQSYVNLGRQLSGRD
jgi:hypothetical protein